MSEWIASFYRMMADFLSSPTFIFSPVYILSSVAIVYVYWRIRVREGGFLAYLFPRAIYRHASTRVDIQVFVFNLVFLATGSLSLVAFAPLVTHAVLGGLGALFSTGPVEQTVLSASVAVFLIFLVQDFCRFLNHYLHHKNVWLWPFHAVHHSAEVLSPLTFYRAHPVYYAFQRILFSIGVGACQGVVLFALIGEIELWMVYATTLIYQAYIFVGAHIRHSHVRLSFGRTLEHIFISPAQHQVHHSSDPKHFDKNFGETFAFWDWMFGTLYIADGDEDLVFGIADADGNRIEQPHNSLKEAMLEPFRDVYTMALQRARMAREPDLDAAAAMPEGGPGRDLSA